MNDDSDEVLWEFLDFVKSLCFEKLNGSSKNMTGTSVQ